MPAVTRRDSTSPYDSLSRKQVISNLRRNLPKELIGLKAFVVFKFAPSKNPGGKVRKIPYYVKSRRVRAADHGTEEDVSQMATFADAVQLYASDKRFAGIGVCAHKDHDVFFIDIDNCVNLQTGEVSDNASELLTWNTYTEVSPSGHGLRMVMLGNPQSNSKKNGIELFSTKGFVTLTGMPFSKTHRPSRINKHQLKTLNKLQETEHQQDTDEIRNIPSPLTPERLKDAKRAIKHIDPDCSYEEWLLVGQALHSGDSDPTGKGFRLWLSWSQKGAKFEATSEEDMAKKWSSFNSGRGVTLSSLFHLAQNSGYKGRTDDALSDSALIETLDPGSVQEIETSPLAEGLFDNHGAYLFIGRAKIGKSRILGAMVAGALTGSSAIGFKFLKHCKVLALCLEEDPSDLMGRIRLYGVEPTEYSKQLVIVDESIVAKNVGKYSEEHTWHAWLDKLLKQEKPDFCYIDTTIKLKLMWQNDPEYRSRNITEQDYQNASLIETLAKKHNCVIVNIMHATKRKTNPTHIFDPFDTIGTTSWALAGCTGALVVGDKPTYQALDDADDGGRVFSVRGRYLRSGDSHYLLQSNVSGTFDNMGQYQHVQATIRQQEYLRIIWDLFREGQEYVTARQVAMEAGRTQHTVKVLLEKFMKDGVTYEEHILQGVPGRGYTFVMASKAEKQRKNSGTTSSARNDFADLLG